MTLNPNLEPRILVPGATKLLGNSLSGTWEPRLQNIQVGPRIREPFFTFFTFFTAIFNIFCSFNLIRRLIDHSKFFNSYIFNRFIKSLLIVANLIILINHKPSGAFSFPAFGIKISTIEQKPSFNPKLWKICPSRTFSFASVLLNIYSTLKSSKKTVKKFIVRKAVDLQISALLRNDFNSTK